MNVSVAGQRAFYWLLVGLMLAACELEPPPEPTFTRQPSLAPSAAVLPVIPDEGDIPQVGFSEPTSAALAAEGEPSQDAPFSPEPTQAIIPITIIGDNGNLLTGRFFGAATRPAPALLIISSSAMPEQSELLAFDLAGLGVHVMLMPPDITSADALASLETLATLPDISTLAVLGWGEGASAALVACGGDNRCVGAILLEPLPTESPFNEAVGSLGNTPLLALGESLSSESMTTIAAIRPDANLQSRIIGTEATAIVAWLQNLARP